MASTETRPTKFSYMGTMSASPVECCGKSYYFAEASSIASLLILILVYYCVLLLTNGLENSIFGGGWYTVGGVSKIVTSPVPVPGFSLSYISGDGGASNNTVWRYSFFFFKIVMVIYFSNCRWPYWDASSLNINYAPKEVNAELIALQDTTGPVNLTMRLTTNMNGKIGIVHVLYGMQGSNTNIDG